MKKLSAMDVAYYLLGFVKEYGDFLSNLKLQKLLYYTQGWHLGLYNKPLFNEDFEAWIHGPVIPSVYQEFREFGASPITSDVPKISISIHVKTHIDDVLQAYLGYSAYDLERMAHNEPVWKRVRQGLEPDEPSQRIIPKKLIKEYFSSLANA